MTTCAFSACLFHRQRNVLRAAGGTNRGKTATSGQRAAILSLLQRLEACNTTSDPAQSPLLNGTWALLYQAPLDEARAEVDKSGTTEGPFLAALQPAGRGVIRTKSNLQLIDIPGGRVENKAEFRVLDR